MMNHLSIIVIAALICLNTFAATAKPKAKASAQPIQLGIQTTVTQTQPAGQGGGGAADLLNSTKIAPEVAAPKGQTPAISLGCTGSDGRSYKRGDSNYDECVRDAQTNQAAPGNGVKPGSTATLKIGN